MKFDLSYIYVYFCKIYCVNSLEKLLIIKVTVTYIPLMTKSRMGHFEEIHVQSVIWLQLCLN